MKPFKLQSAMEYLMTYGWAILIIAIVLGVLYYLGVFGGATTAPRAQAGSCQVFRPNGPGTSYDTGLSGTCNNELPEYVAEFNGNGYISIPTTGSNINSGTFSFWFNPSAVTGGNQYLVTTSGTVQRIYFVMEGSTLAFILGTGSNTIGSMTVNTNTWYSVIGEWSGTAANLYVNGQLVHAGSFNALTSVQNPMWIGAFGTFGQSYNGVVSDVQFYNITLSANEVQALYLEGIGGAPVNPAYLVGWWPLNSNPSDYSGNLNSGVTSNVLYTSSWSSGYTQP